VPQLNTPPIQSSLSELVLQVDNPAPAKYEETYRPVEVAFVVVELTPVKFCRVVEPLTSRLEIDENTEVK